MGSVRLRQASLEWGTTNLYLCQVLAGSTREVAMCPKIDIPSPDTCGAKEPYIIMPAPLPGRWLEVVPL